MSKGRIVKIEKNQNRLTYIEQGIKKDKQYKYENYPGGNGTYVTGGEYLGTSLDVKIMVYDLDKCFTFDVYEQVLAIEGKSRISSQLLERIMSHEGDKVDVIIEDKRVDFDVRQLLN